jgi:hypothetical protein
VCAYSVQCEVSKVSASVGVRVGTHDTAPHPSQIAVFEAAAACAVQTACRRCSEELAAIMPGLSIRQAVLELGSCPVCPWLAQVETLQAIRALLQELLHASTFDEHGRSEFALGSPGPRPHRRSASGAPPLNRRYCRPDLCLALQASSRPKPLARRWISPRRRQRHVTWWTATVLTACFKQPPLKLPCAPLVLVPAAGADRSAGCCGGAPRPGAAQ